MSVHAVFADAKVDPDRLLCWMDSQALGQGRIEAARLLSGGTQNILVLFERAGRRYVLRRPPANPRPESNQTMRREARVLGALAGVDVPHARLIAACADEAEMGFAFYLMEPVDGYNPTEALPAEAQGADAQRAMGLALVDALSSLGRVDHEAVGLGDFGKPEGYLERQVPRWMAQLENYSKFSGWHRASALPGVERIARWLDEHRPAGFRPGVQHGDFHLGNVMFALGSPRIAAIVDWELATIGDPLLDLGWLLATWPNADGTRGAFEIQPWRGFPSADELIERYAQRSTRSLEAIDWYVVMACFKLGILQEGTMARAQAGLAPIATGERLHRLAVQLFERAHERISGAAPPRPAPIDARVIKEAQTS